MVFSVEDEAGPMPGSISRLRLLQRADSRYVDERHLLQQNSNETLTTYVRPETEHR
jgi:hypothetical protein